MIGEEEARLMELPPTLDELVYRGVRLGDRAAASLISSVPDDEEEAGAGRDERADPREERADLDRRSLP